jgi:hypothetical protein
MKYILIIIAVFIMVMPITSEETLNTIKMGDFDKTLQGFSLSKGELVTVDMEEGLALEIDFIFDMPNGIGMNNKDLTSQFRGSAGIFDLGPVSLDDESSLSPEDYSIFLKPDEIISGNTYFIKTSVEGFYGKIHIVDFDNEKEIIEFTWVSLEE